MNKKFKRMISLPLSLLIVATVTGCSLGNSKTTASTAPATDTSDVQAKAKSELTQLKITDSAVQRPELETYNGSFFTVKKPKDWVIETTGEYETFGFRMYDKNVPARQIFYYGSMGPFLKSAHAKTFWQQYVNNGGYAQAALYADAPVLVPAKTGNFLRLFNEFAAFAIKHGIKHNFPSLESFSDIETVNRNSSMGSAALDDSIVRGVFKQNGVPCEGFFGATVMDSIKYPANGVDAGYYTMYAVIGISAPTDEFSTLQDVLTEAISSFQFSQSYINQGVQQNNQETQAVIQVGKILSEANDSYNKAWRERQRSGDASAQKYGDSILGYDRLYDKETGETYRAESGFWEEYQSNREKYANQNIEMVPSEGYDLLNKAVDGYIIK